MQEPDLTRGTKLYVPAPDTPYRKIIKPGSGIVGTDYGMGRIELYYEGNLYGAANMETFEDRVYHAWDRCVQHYPTVATVVLDAGDVIEVGDVIPQVGRRPILRISDQAALDAWLEGWTEGGRRDGS